MPDQIIINDLEVFYSVGVPAAERAQPQRLQVSIEMDQDFGAAAATDDLEKTINYHAVAQRLFVFGHNREWRLIETLAVDIAEMVLSDFNAKRVSVEVKKFIIPQARHVAVRAERRRNDD